MKKIRLESRILDFIQQHSLIPPGETVLAGVSGGADSVCLLHVLARCQRRLGINLHVAHLNHQLRGAESQADASYVANLADRLSIAITIDKQDVASYKAQRNCSIEEAARGLRYNFLARVANDIGANRVAIGHTKDDQVETILMHILRGTGTSGLRGLEPYSPMVYGKEGTSSQAKRSNLSVIRPLLDTTREETLNYCQEQQLEPRSDSSNLSLIFFRNRLRLELLPLLRGYNPSIDQALLRLAKIARDDSSFIEQQALQLWSEVAKQEENAIHLNKRKARALPIALQRQIVRLAIDKLVGDTQDIEASHIEAVRGLLDKPVGKKTSLPHGLVCWSEYNEIVVVPSRLSPNKGRENRGSPHLIVPHQIRGSVEWVSLSPLQGEFPLNIPGNTVLPGWRVISSIMQERNLPVIASTAKQSQQKGRDFVAELDLHKTGTELLVRQRQPGDRFQPLGMNMPKKLQDFMVDAKIHLSWRKHIPIVCSPQQIIWVVGWRIDDRVKVTVTTKEVLHLEFIKSP
ncbi:MAG: tRNA lysidine(34) synthetase TilS [Dehalococcoidia bacterium]|nr:tRNA lysidine(34) synthetase TilS [Dehalococcoidia bacterium]